MLEAILAGIVGLIVGSFLNVCIYRWPLDLSVIRPSRSFCPSCKETISWYDNVPVFSWVILGARCRYCSAAISARYPAVELATGLLFGFGVYALGATPTALKFCVFAAIQVALFFTDLEERILPDEFTKGGILAGIGLAALVRMPPGVLELMLPEEWDWRLKSVVESVFAAFFLSGLLWGIGALYQRIRSREGLGLGDVKMVGTIGAFLGLGGALFTLVVGSVLGSICGLLFIYFARKDPSTYELPFGSFLAFAALMMAVQIYPMAALFPPQPVTP